MLAYDLIDGGGGVPTAPVPADYKLPWISVKAVSLTSIEITLGSPNATPGSYGGSITTLSFNDPDFTDWLKQYD